MESCCFGTIKFLNLWDFQVIVGPRGILVFWGDQFFESLGFPRNQKPPQNHSKQSREDDFRYPLTLVLLRLVYFSLLWLDLMRICPSDGGLYGPFWEPGVFNNVFYHYDYRTGKQGHLKLLLSLLLLSLLLLWTTGNTLNQQLFL